MKHFEACAAPICADLEAYESNSDWQETVPWYPGEAVCGMKPYTKWQKRQAKMNRWLESGTLKYLTLFFTVETLLRKKSLYRGIKGGNPDAKIG